jgi:hypothetical protein
LQMQKNQLSNHVGGVSVRTSWIRNEKHLYV